MECFPLTWPLGTECPLDYPSSVSTSLPAGFSFHRSPIPPPSVPDLASCRQSSSNMHAGVCELIMSERDCHALPCPVLSCTLCHAHGTCHTVPDSPPPLPSPIFHILRLGNSDMMKPPMRLLHAAMDGPPNQWIATNAERLSRDGPHLLASPWAGLLKRMGSVASQ